MKKIILGLTIGILLTIPLFVFSAPNLADKLKGKILLAVEDYGKTYYVHEDGNRYRITSATAHKIFEKLALGITNKNLEGIPLNDVGIDPENKIVCNPEIIYKDRVIYQDKIIYKDRIVDKNSDELNQCLLDKTMWKSQYDECLYNCSKNSENNEESIIFDKLSVNLEFNKPYISKTGITVTIANIEKIEEVGFYKYVLSYKQENKTTNTKFNEGTFKMFFEDNTSLNQYGFFDELFPNESITKIYTFQILKTQKPFCIEFNDNVDTGLEGSFFRNQPAVDTLKWKIN